MWKRKIISCHHRHCRSLYNSKSSFLTSSPYSLSSIHHQYHGTQQLHKNASIFNKTAKTTAARRLSSTTRTASSAATTTVPRNTKIKNFANIPRKSLVGSVSASFCTAIDGNNLSDSNISGAYQNDNESNDLLEYDTKSCTDNIDINNSNTNDIAKVTPSSSAVATTTPGQSYSSDINDNNSNLETIARELLSYESYDDAIQDYMAKKSKILSETNNSSNTNPQLLLFTDIFNVINYYVSLQASIASRGIKGKSRGNSYSYNYRNKITFFDSENANESKRNTSNLLLSKHLSHLVNNLVLPSQDNGSHENNDVLLSRIVDIVHLVLRSYSIDTKIMQEQYLGNNKYNNRNINRTGIEVTLDDIDEARKMFYKLLSLKCTQLLSRKDQKQLNHKLRLCLNHILESYAQLSLKLRTSEERKVAVRNCEHLLLDVGSCNTNISAISDDGSEREDQELLSLPNMIQPDCISFNIVIGAWGKYGKIRQQGLAQQQEENDNDEIFYGAERGEALLNLMLELQKEYANSNSNDDDDSHLRRRRRLHRHRYYQQQLLLKPTTQTYDTVLKGWLLSSGYNNNDLSTNIAPERSVLLLQDMVAKYEANPDQNPKPSLRTFVNIFTTLARSNLHDIHLPITNLLHILESLHLKANTILYNAILNAYYRSSTKTLDEKYEICQHMNNIIHKMEVSSASFYSYYHNHHHSTGHNDGGDIQQLPDKVSYQTVIQAWVDCGHLPNQSHNVRKECSLHAKRHLYAASDRNIFLDIHTYNHVMSSLSQIDVEETINMFESIRSSGGPIVPTLETYKIVLGSIEDACFAGNRDQAGSGYVNSGYSNVERERHRVNQSYNDRNNDKSNGMNHIMLVQAAERYLNEMQSLSRDDPRRFHSLRADTACYNSIISLWIGLGKIENAISLLDELCKAYYDELNEVHANKRIVSRPNTTSFMNVISSLKNSNDDEMAAMEKIEVLLERMENMANERRNAPKQLAVKMANVEPNIITYNILLEMYAKNCQAHEDVANKAEALIARLEEASNNDNDPGHGNYNIQPPVATRPDKYTYSILMKIYERAAIDNSAQRIDDLLNRLVIDQKQGIKIKGNNNTVDTAFLNLVIKDVKNRPGSEPKNAERLLLDMESGKFGDNCRPDARTYATVIDAYKGLGYDAAVHAEEIFDRFVAFSEKFMGTGDTIGRRKDLVVDTACYNSLIGVYAASRTSEGVTCCNELLNQMEERYRNGHHNIRPDKMTYNTVMSVSKPQRAEEIYQHMMKRYKSDSNNTTKHRSKPDRFTFIHLLNSWINDSFRSKGRKQSINAIKNAENILREKDAFNVEDNRIFATTSDYNKVLKRWKNIRCPDRAEELLDRMYERYMEGVGFCLPDIKSYQIVLEGYVGSTTSGDNVTNAQTAQRLLNRMLERYESDGKQRRNPKPDRGCFLNVMKAWAYSNEIGCHLKIEQLLNQYKKISQEDDDYNFTKPDIAMYDTLLCACAYSSFEGPTKSSPELLDRCIKHFQVIIKESSAGIEHMQPTDLTYAYMFQIIGNGMGKEDPRYIPLITHLFESCKENGKASKLVLDKLQKYCTPDVCRRILKVN